MGKTYWYAMIDGAVAVALSIRESDNGTAPYDKTVTAIGPFKTFHAAKRDMVATCRAAVKAAASITERDIERSMEE